MDDSSAHGDSGGDRGADDDRLVRSPVLIDIRLEGKHDLRRRWANVPARSGGNMSVLQRTYSRLALKDWTLARTLLTLL